MATPLCLQYTTGLLIKLKNPGLLGVLPWQLGPIMQNYTDTATCQFLAFYLYQCCASMPHIYNIDSTNKEDKDLQH